jgi:diguanylate cyclase (GGDEF)-like protein
MHGYEVGELLHREAQVLAPQRLHRTSSLRNPEKCELWRRESVNRRKDGEEFRVHLSSISVRNPQGEFLGMVTACEDITERKKNEARIQTLAYFDSLTGLPNRSLFLNRLQKALSQAERSKQTVAVLFLDLDNFKNINDTEGHGFGDRLLKEVARRLTGCIRAADTLARLGGDEFVVLLASSEKKMASSTALRILESFRPPFEIEGRLTYASFSIGIALYPDDASNMKDLLRSADTAMYKAKAGGRQNFQFFSPQMNKEVVEKVAMESALRQALDREELTLCCQPHWDLQTGSRYVVEVSARWLHPELGEISPKHFLPLAESSGLIFRLGEWVLRSACNQAKVWTDVGCPVERVAVSISGHQLRQAGFANFIERILVETKLDPNFLELELTESVLINQGEQNLPVMQALKRMGIHLSIDDFGIGYSSLSYLKNFPVDRIKIDRSFVAGIDGDPGNAAIVAAIIALARILKIGVLAKGVETLAQLEFLQQHGCSESLGFLLEDPMTEADLVRWLNHPPVPLSVTSGISSRT